MSRSIRWRVVAFTSVSAPPVLSSEAARVADVLGLGVRTAWRMRIMPQVPAAARAGASILPPESLYPSHVAYPRWMSSFLLESTDVVGEVPSRARTALVDRPIDLGWDQASLVRVYDQFAGAAPIEPSDLVQVFLARRHDAMSQEKFESRYSAHADIVIAHGPSFRRYLASVAAVSDSAWDGFSEQWFESREHALEHARQLREGLKPDVVADAQAFVGASQAMSGRIEETWGDADEYLGLRSTAAERPS